MIRVFLVDDHHVVRHGLRNLIEATDDLCVSGEAWSGHGVESALRTHPSDVVVMDLSLPRVGGVEALRRVRESFPTMRIVVFSMYAEVQHASRIMALGASAYVGKDRDPSCVLDAIRASSAPPGGEQAPTPGTDASLRSLTPREYQVFFLVLEGRSVSEMAAELNLHSSTVSNLLRGVKEKLGAKSTAALVQFARSVGLLA